MPTPKHLVLAVVLMCSAAPALAAPRQASKAPDLSGAVFHAAVGAGALVGAGAVLVTGLVAFPVSLLVANAQGNIRSLVDGEMVAAMTLVPAALLAGGMVAAGAVGLGTASGAAWDALHHQE